MKRKLVAALACRNVGSRLYGKPLQRLNDSVCILDQIIQGIQKFPEIDEIVLGISEGVANLAFIDVAHSHKVSFILGDPVDVLFRLVQCGRMGKATDVFRVTTECPWFAYDMSFPKVGKHVVGKPRALGGHAKNIGRLSHASALHKAK